MNYEQIFATRGAAYDRAMQRWPEARRDDFQIPIGWLAPQPGETIVDVPAGGGYLERYLPEGVRCFGHEPSAGFREPATATGTELLPLPWPDGFADAAISIAGVHHLEDKRPLFRELRRVTRSTGRLVVADAHEDSAVGRFLDGFVGAHNSTGHAGRYLGAATLVELNESGWWVERAERVHFCWWFADRKSLVGCVRLLFDLGEVDDALIQGAVEHHLGLSVRGREIGMNWELFVVRATPR